MSREWYWREMRDSEAAETDDVAREADHQNGTESWRLITKMGSYFQDFPAASSGNVAELRS